jgi:hypothetical protein
MYPLKSILIRVKTGLKLIDQIQLFWKLYPIFPENLSKANNLCPPVMVEFNDLGNCMTDCYDKFMAQILLN